LLDQPAVRVADLQAADQPRHVLVALGRRLGDQVPDLDVQFGQPVGPVRLPLGPRAVPAEPVDLLAEEELVHPQRAPGLEPGGRALRAGRGRPATARPAPPRRAGRPPTASVATRGPAPAAPPGRVPGSTCRAP